VFRKGVVVGQTQARMYTWEKSAKSGSATMLAKRVTLLYDIDNRTWTNNTQSTNWLQPKT
jgi:hypothetical protein